MTDTILDIRNITKSFGGLSVSKNVSLTLKTGEIHALIGPNGAGKSTLIKQITGALNPDSGSIWFNGENVSQLSTAARTRLGMGRTFQISSLAMDYSVLQNAVLGALGQRNTVFRFFDRVMHDKELQSRALQALNAVGLNDFATARTADLSHGQRRQLEVAIALTLKPRAFLMDEPMAGLGAEGSQHLIALLNKLKGKAPILLIEHDMDAVFALADRISVLVYGEIIATGSVDEIRSDQRVRSAYLGDGDGS